MFQLPNIIKPSLPMALIYQAVTTLRGNSFN